MPGVTTVQALPYPYINEGATPVSVQNLANQVDTKLTAKDASRVTALTRDTVRVRNSGSFSVPVNTITTAAYNVEDYDVGGLANLGVNNDRLIVVKTGLYYIHGSVWCDDTGGTITAIETSLARNGTQFVRHKERSESASGGIPRHIGVSAIRALTAADFIQLIAFWAGTAGPYNFFEATLGARLIAV